MAKQVPKFGAWAAEGNENFTVYFDNARKNKTNGKMIDPNDPQENPQFFKQNQGLVQAPPNRKRPESKGQKSKVPQFGAWDSGDGAGYTVCFDNARKSKTNEVPTTIDKNSAQFKQGAATQSRPASATVKPEPPEQRSKVPQFGGWDQGGGEVAYTACFDNVRKTKNDPTVGREEPRMNRDVSADNKDARSKVPQFGGWNDDEDQPAQYTAYFDKVQKPKGPTVVEPQLNRDIAERGRGNPNAGKVRHGSEHRGAAEEKGHQRNGGRGSTASASQSPLHQRGGKSQLKPSSRGNGNPERGATIPTFGGWNNNPGVAEGYTGAFTRAKEERMTPLNNVAAGPYQHQSYQANQDTKKGCCFPWF